MERVAGELAACVAVVTLGLACAANPMRSDGEGDRGDTKPPDVNPLDGGEDDLALDASALPDAPPVPSNMGEGCVSSGPCLAGSPDCFIVDQESQLGICTRTCKQDDPNTPFVDEHDCPEGFICSEFRYGDRKFFFCFKKCTPSSAVNPCPLSSQTTCHPVSTRFTDLEQTVCLFLACQDDADCPVLADTPCKKDAECVALGADAFCEQKTKRCARPGTCTPGGLCGKHTLGDARAAVGDPCTGDFDCPSNAVCYGEEQLIDGTTLYRNGYCTVRFCSFAKELPDFSCPAGSSCLHYFYGGLCHKNCELADEKSCRGNPGDAAGDYECYAWDRLRLSGEPVAEQPVCQAALPQRCDSFGQSVSCSDLGLQNNPTNMRCRDPKTGAQLPIRDPQGVCLDDTVSGAFERTVDGGGASDGGIDGLAFTDGG